MLDSQYVDAFVYRETFGNMPACEFWMGLMKQTSFFYI